jgi:hypothetical protein
MKKQKALGDESVQWELCSQSRQFGALSTLLHSGNCFDSKGAQWPFIERTYDSNNLNGGEQKFVC